MEFTLKEEILDKLEQVLESIEVIQDRCKDYRSLDDKTHQELFANYPQIPWRKIIGLRNIISHEYANIDYDIIWIVIIRHLPPLKVSVELVKKEVSDI